MSWKPLSNRKSTYEFFENNTKENSQKRRGRPVNFKPFCDCKDCACEDCPDILQCLSIKFSNETCYFGPKSLEKSLSTESFYDKSLVGVSLMQCNSSKSKSRSKVHIVSPKSSKASSVGQKSSLPKSNIKRKESSKTSTTSLNK